MSRKLAKKVLLIGWDAADWKVISPLIDAGKMPNLERFVNQGVMGNLATLYPSLSPMLWTSIATGKRPFKHGIFGFTEPAPNSAGIRPISTLSRKTRAIWNILNLQGMKSNVVGWWPSHPTEPINGVMVSNHFQQVVDKIDKPWPVMPGAIHPAELTEKLAAFRVHPQELTDEHIGPFVPDFGKVDQEKDHRLEMLAKIISECTSIHGAATALMQLEPWDFMAVYYDAIDHFCHGFMRYHPPRLDWVNEKDFEIFKGVVESGYRYHDMMLGALLALAGEETTIILVSDHGFHPDHLRPVHVPHEPAGPAVQHRHHGIFVMKGPNVKKDERIYGANLLDVTPTILTAFGLPIGEDMDGKALVNAFLETNSQDVEEKQKKDSESEHDESHGLSLKTIPSWDDIPGEDGALPADMALDPIAARESINQLVALGYIEKPNEDNEKAAAQAVRELHYNLARSYMDANLHINAITYLEKLAKEWPDEYRFTLHLVSCYQALKRNKEAKKALEELFELKTRNMVKAAEELKEWKEKQKGTKIEDLEEDKKRELSKLHAQASRNPYAPQYLMGVQLMAEGDYKGALVCMKNAEKIKPDAAQLHITKGELLLQMKKWEDAEASFRRALEIDPEQATAHVGICRSFLNRKRNREAVQEALDAVRLLYNYPVAHYFLGVALHRMRRIPRAVEALKVAVRQNPNSIKAHERLAYIYKNRFKDPETAEDFLSKAEEARKRIADIKKGIVTGDSRPDLRPLPTSDQDVLETDEIILASAKAPMQDSTVIVSGLPRSGTSLMMQMLKSGGLPVLTDNVRKADTHNEKGYFEYTPVKSIGKDTSWVIKAKGKAVKVIAQLVPTLPMEKEHNYRIIFMERDLREAVASQHDMLRSKDTQGAYLPDAQLRLTFAAQLRSVRKLLTIAKIPVLYVSYSECIDDPSGTAAKVNEFLDDSLDATKMADVVNTNLYRHRLLSK